MTLKCGNWQTFGATAVFVQVRMSELHSDCVVLTTDSDFFAYRRNGRQNIPLLSPS